MYAYTYIHVHTCTYLYIRPNGYNVHLCAYGRLHGYCLNSYIQCTYIHVHVHTHIHILF